MKFKLLRRDEPRRHHVFVTHFRRTYPLSNLRAVDFGSFLRLFLHQDAEARSGFIFFVLSSFLFECSLSVRDQHATPHQHATSPPPNHPHHPPTRRPPRTTPTTPLAAVVQRKPLARRRPLCYLRGQPAPAVNASHPCLVKGNHQLRSRRARLSAALCRMQWTFTL